VVVNGYYRQCVPNPTVLPAIAPKAVSAAPSAAPVTKAPTATPTLANTAVQSAYGQCGGIGWNGPTQCGDGFSCVKSNDYYYQCVPTPTAVATVALNEVNRVPPSASAAPTVGASGVQSAYQQCGDIGSNSVRVWK
jgi:hypothetical protein